QVSHEPRDPEVVCDLAECIGRQQKDAEQEQGPGRDDALRRHAERLEEHGNTDEEGENDEPADHALGTGRSCKELSQAAASRLATISKRRTDSSVAVRTVAAARSGYTCV